MRLTEKLILLIKHFKGYFATEAALNTAYPTAENGDYAIVGSTDTVWVWDGDTTAWVDTGNGATGDVVGPGSAIADNLAAFDGITGKLLKDGGIAKLVIDLNTTHRSSGGTDHSNVGLNNTHRGSAGTDHSNVGLNNTHRGSDGSDHSFIDQSVISGSSPILDAANITGVVTGTVELLHLDVRKGSVGTIAARTPLYISGYNASGWIEVEEADADIAAQMPAIGVANVAITNAATRRIVNSGELTGLATNDGGWAINDPIYVAGGGGLTKTKPTGTTLIQKIAEIARVHVNAGVLIVVGAGRSNDIPNLPSNKIWLGNGSGVPAEVDFDTEVSANTDVINAMKITALTSSASITPNGNSAIIKHYFTLTYGHTGDMLAVTNQVEGCEYIFKITQDGTGGRVVTWNANYKFDGSTKSILSTGLGDIDQISFISDGTNLIHSSSTYNAG